MSLVCKFWLLVVETEVWFRMVRRGLLGRKNGTDHRSSKGWRKKKESDCQQTVWIVSFEKNVERETSFEQFKLKEKEK